MEAFQWKENPRSSLSSIVFIFLHFFCCLFVESLFETQAEATWRQQVRAREFQGEKDKKTRNKEEFIKWKEENRKGIENILRTAFAIQVC